MRGAEMMAADLLVELAGATALAHDEIHAGESVWAAWNVDPELLLPVALVGVLYARGLGRWRERSREHASWRVVSYYAGLAVLVLALESPIDRLGLHHLTFHMLQHELLLMVAAPLILLGAPTTPVLLGLPRRLRMDAVRPLARREAVRRLYRWLTHPLFAVLLLTTMLWAWHLAPGWYDAALRNELLHDIQHISYAAVGALFWWGVIDPAPLRSRMPYALRMGYLLVGGTPKHLLAALITFAGEPLYDAYAEVEPIVSLSLLDDQGIGGLIMWAPSQMMHLLAIAAVFFVWAHKSEQEQREFDAERLGLEPARGGGAPGAT